MATPSPSPIGRPDRDFIEGLFEQQEFQSRLRWSMVKLALAFVAALGITAAGVTIWIGKTLYDGANTLNQKVTDKQKDAEERLAASLKGFDAAQARVKELENQARTASERAVEASQDAARQGPLLMTQGNTLGATASLLAQLMDKMQARMEKDASSLAGTAASLEEQAARFKADQAKQALDQAKIKETQESLDRAQKDLDGLRTKLAPDVEKTLDNIQSLRKVAGEVARYKTMEFVSLRRNSAAAISLKHVQVNASGEMDTPTYDLLFSTGKLKPLDLGLKVGSRLWNYPDVQSQKTSHQTPTRSAYCICGTPFMFRVENYVQEVLIHDFVTLKILDRTADCLPPQGATCP
jgi:hypothetical protein